MPKGSSVNQKESTSMFADFAKTVDAVVICLFFFLVILTAPTTPTPVTAVTTAAPGPMPDISKFLL